MRQADYVQPAFCVSLPRWDVDIVFLFEVEQDDETFSYPSRADGVEPAGEISRVGRYCPVGGWSAAGGAFSEGVSVGDTGHYLHQRFETGADDGGVPGAALSLPYIS